MFAGFLNDLNGKNSSRTIVLNIFSNFFFFFFFFLILGFKISYREYSFVTQIVISGIRTVSYLSERHCAVRLPNQRINRFWPLLYLFATLLVMCTMIVR